jgi:hypothetical protein
LNFISRVFGKGVDNHLIPRAVRITSPEHGFRLHAASWFGLKLLTCKHHNTLTEEVERTGVLMTSCKNCGRLVAIDERKG